MMKQEKDLSRQEAMSAAAKAMKPLAEARESTKNRARRQFDEAYTEAEKEINEKRRALDVAFDEEVKALERTREDAFEHARKVMREAAQPLEKKAFEDSAQIDKDFIDEIAKIDAAEVAAATKVNKDIATLEKELGVGQFAPKAQKKENEKPKEAADGPVA